MENNKQPIKTALYDEHVKREGKMVNFNGYSLPVWFTSIKDEHLAVRNDVGAFDISHMGVLKIKGENAQSFLQQIVCNDLAKAVPNKMVYAMILNKDGGVKDDAMVGNLEEDFMFVVNASNKGKILSWLANFPQDGIEIEDLTVDYGFLAVQGPNAAKKLTEIFNLELESRGRFSAFYETILDTKCIMMRTGYTGEDGFEIVIPNNKIAEIWSTIIDAGVTPCGLGARDTLRIEFGLPLYGQELSETVHPYMTRYKWVVKLNNDFNGKEALEALKDQPAKFATVGLEMQDRVIPRTHYEIKEGGYITSGTLSPVLDKPIALAFVNPEYTSVGTEVTVMMRGKEHKATVVPVPFVKK